MKLKAPLTKEEILKLKAGDTVYISGEMLTMRDKAHMRILEYIEESKDLPVELNGAIVYHCGPLVKEKDGWIVISAGPTTSARMNEMTVKMLKRVETIAIIGKGGMSKEVVEGLREKGVYLAYTGGAGALAAKAIKVKGLCWNDLGMPEAIWFFEVEHFGPCIVGIDAYGRSLYAEVEERVERNYNSIVQNMLYRKRYI